MVKLELKKGLRGSLFFVSYLLLWSALVRSARTGPASAPAKPLWNIHRCAGYFYFPQTSVFFWEVFLAAPNGRCVVLCCAGREAEFVRREGELRRLLEERERDFQKKVEKLLEQVGNWDPRRLGEAGRVWKRYMFRKSLLDQKSVCLYIHTRTVFVCLHPTLIFTQTLKKMLCMVHNSHPNKCVFLDTAYTLIWTTMVLQSVTMDHGGREKLVDIPFTVYLFPLVAIWILWALTNILQKQTYQLPSCSLIHLHFSWFKCTRGRLKESPEFTQSQLQSPRCTERAKPIRSSRTA